MGLLVLHPKEQVWVLRCHFNLLWVPPRELDHHEDGVEVVQIDVEDGAVEKEATGFEVRVGDGVVIGDSHHYSGGGGDETVAFDGNNGGFEVR